MRNAGNMLLISAALHVVGYWLSGFAMPFLLFPVLVYCLLFAGLARGMLWVAWIALICMIGGIAGTIIELFGPSLVPAWVLWGILAADAAALVLLFAAIWAGPKAT